MDAATSNSRRESCVIAGDTTWARGLLLLGAALALYVLVASGAARGLVAAAVRPWRYGDLAYFDPRY